MKKSYWIKERNNPQFKNPYYVKCGQLSKKDAKAKENSAYGYNIMYEYKTEEEYNLAIQEFTNSGFSVHE